MIKQVNFNNFCDGFRGTYENNFSCAGKQALFNYLEDYEESTDDTIEFDPVALCCEYTEYENIEAYNSEYNSKNPVTSIEDIEDLTTVIRIPDSESFIILQY